MDSLSPDALLQNAVKNGGLTHYFWAVGSLDDAKNSWTRSGSSLPGGRVIFDLASLTKALVTTPLVYEKVHSAQWTLRDPIPFPGKITLEELLTHTSGLPAWRSFYARLFNHKAYKNLEPKECISLWISQVLSESTKETSQKSKPYCYSDLGFILLGYLLEQEEKQTLNELFRALLKKLDLKETSLGYFPLDNRQPFCIPTSYCPLRRRWLSGEVHDENAWALGGGAGHAGLFGSGPDVWRFLVSYLKSSEGQGFIVENKGRIAQTQPVLGWQQGDGESSSSFGKGKSIGHLGFTGTAFWYDLERKKLAILLTNRVISSRQSPWITALRRDVFALLDRS